MHHTHAYHLCAQVVLALTGSTDADCNNWGRMRLLTNYKMIKKLVDMKAENAMVPHIKMCMRVSRPCTTHFLPWIMCKGRNVFSLANPFIVERATSFNLSVPDLNRRLVAGLLLLLLTGRGCCCMHMLLCLQVARCVEEEDVRKESLATLVLFKWLKNFAKVRQQLG